MRWAAHWRCERCLVHIWRTSPQTVEALLTKYKKAFLPRPFMQGDDSSVDSAGDAGTEGDDEPVALDAEEAFCSQRAAGDTNIEVCPPRRHNHWHIHLKSPPL